MKKSVISLIITLLTNFVSFGQSTFISDSDVLFYLNNKRTFSNRDNGITLTFSDDGSRISTGHASYYNPDIVVLSETRAYATYQSLTSIDASVKFIVDSKDNIIIDRNDRTVYRASSTTSNQENSNFSNNDSQNTSKPIKETITKPKESNYDFLPKYVVGSYFSKELGTTIVIEKIPYKTESNYWRNPQDLHGDAIKNSMYKWDLRLKVTTNTGKTFNLNLEGYNRETLDFNLDNLNYTVYFGKNIDGYTLSYILNEVPVVISSQELKPERYIFTRIK
jgi:hypothetical protein